MYAKMNGLCFSRKLKERRIFPMKYIYTCQPTASKLASSEFKKEDASYRFIDWLDSGVGYMESTLSLSQLNHLIKTTPIIFVRHLFEVDAMYECNCTENAIESLHEFALHSLSNSETFSLQIRSIDNEMMKTYRNEVREQLSSLLKEDGYQEDMKQGLQVLSVFLTKKCVYVGCSRPSMNLSKWNGGMMHCAKDGMISRAEFKLLEAIEVFDLDMTKFQSALDLGAAPGGWSNALLGFGLNVTAIDPAKMNTEVLNHPKLTHYKEMTQTFLTRDLSQHYDLIVNDMKMDVLQSATITNEFEHVLSDNGYIIMTFKLPNHYNYLMVKRGVEELSKCYDYVTARQLFHNRSEVTVLFQKKKAK